MALKIPDDLNAPASPDLPPPDPQFAPPPGDFNLSGKKSRAPLFIVLAILVGGAGFAGYRMVGTRKTKEMHARFMNSFAGVDKDDVGAFWACVIGPNRPPSSFESNIDLGKTLDAAVAGDPKGYPDKLMDDCIPRLNGLGSKAKGLDAPADYSDALASYAKSLDGLADGLKDWAEHAKTRLPEREADKRVEQAGTAFHSAAPDKAGADAIGYDRFLRCAVPNLDKMKDEQELLQHLFDECKKPEFVQKARFECSKLAGQTEVTKEDKNYKASWKKFAPDDRDIQAFSDCFRKGRKGAKTDDMATFGKAWKDYLEAASTVKKIGAEKLKDD